MQLVQKVKVQLDNGHAPQGYNIGVNCGEVAGQTIPHAPVLQAIVKIESENKKGQSKV